MINAYPFHPPFFRILMAALLVAVSSCSTSGSKLFDDQPEAHAGPADEKQKPKFETTSLTAVYDHYIHIKNALVRSNSKEARLGAVALQSALNRHRLKGSKLAASIAQSSNLDVQRDLFNDLSKEIEKLIKAGKIKEGVVYKKYCPMAKNGEGAYWLSGETEIKNPYYGDAMPECGKIVEEIK